MLLKFVTDDQIEKIIGDLIKFLIVLDTGEDPRVTSDVKESLAMAIEIKLRRSKHPPLPEMEIELMSLGTGEHTA